MRALNFSTSPGVKIWGKCTCIRTATVSMANRDLNVGDDSRINLCHCGREFVESIIVYSKTFAAERIHVTRDFSSIALGFYMV